MKYKGIEVNSNNIKSFIEGNILFQVDKKLNLLPLYKKEQVLWRMSVCKDTCMKEKKCKMCGCDVPERMYVDKPYESRKCDYPDFMKKIEWNEYKLQNNIVIDEQFISQIS